MTLEVTEEDGTLDDIRLRALLHGRREIGTFPFPGDDDFRVGIRVLTEEEMDKCQLKAFNYVLNKCQAAGVDVDTFIRNTPELLDIEQQRQILLKALFVDDSDADEPRSFFKHIDAVRCLDTVTRQALFNEYIDWLDAHNTRKRLTEEEADRLVEALKKEPSGRGILAQYDAPTLRTFVRSLAARLQTSPTNRSSSSPT